MKMRMRMRMMMIFCQLQVCIRKLSHCYCFACLVICRPFSCHTKMEDFEHFCVSSLFSWNIFCISNSQIGQHPNKAELLHVNINTGLQSIKTERASLNQVTNNLLDIGESEMMCTCIWLLYFYLCRRNTGPEKDNNTLHDKVWEGKGVGNQSFADQVGYWIQLLTLTATSSHWECMKNNRKLHYRFKKM